jgi:competence protein ComFB
MRNITEEVVSREYERLQGAVDGFCGCDYCRDDVFVYALNRLKPHYVTSREGEVITNIELESEQERSEVSVVLMAGFRRVKGNPRHDRPKASS